MTILESALHYRSLGWSVFPVKVIPGGNGKADKKPLVQWGKFMKRLATEEEIRQWYAKWPNAGIGIATGKLSNLVVLDFDLGSEMKDYNTITVKTGSGGKHYYFKYPADREIYNSASLIAKNVDVRGEGGYVVAPPTYYSGNAYYEWINSPENIKLAEFPRFILKEKIDTWRETGITKAYEREEIIKEGEGRNNTATSYAGYLLNQVPSSLWETTVWPALQQWNQAKCLPPLSLRELRTIYDSIVRTDLRNNPEKVTQNNNKNEKSEIYTQLKKDFFYTDKKGNQKVSSLGIQKIADYFVKNYHIKTMGGEKYREIYIYDDGYYRSEGSSFFKAELEKILEEAWTNHWQGEIIEKIKNLSYVKREEFIVDKDLINLKNGVYNLKTKELLPHSPDYPFLYQIPVNYGPETQCPKIKQFFNEIFEEKDLPLIQEWFGFTLYRDYFIKRALIIYGIGNTGKSTFANILAHFIGITNVSSIPLQKINDKFAAVTLYNKHLNIYDDLSAEDLTDNGAFKVATGRGLMSAEYKFGDRFSFTNYAKLVFCCNKIPSPADIDDDAYFSRWLPINLQKPVPEEKIDNFLLAKVLIEEELSGLLNFALIGLERLLQNGRFSDNKEVSEIRTEMLKSNSSIASFAYNCLEKNIGEFISKEKLYNVYAVYSDENELPVETKDKFGKNLLRYVSYAIDRQGLDSEVKKEVKGWGNVKVKSLFEEQPM